MFDFGIARAIEMWDGSWQIQMRLLFHDVYAACTSPPRPATSCPNDPLGYQGLNRIGKTRYQCPEAFPEAFEDEE
jgi:hypothetical protein